MAGDVRFRRRLEAYAEFRLSPDLATTSRMRARVLAHAHRHADLERADAALTIVQPGAGTSGDVTRSPRAVRRTALSLMAAATLLVSVAGVAAAASGPGGALYEARLFVEEVTLPTDPSERAIAELDRLAQRLAEADAAARAGDHVAAAAALAAYERIMAEASSEVLAANDPVAAAAFETGIGRNVEVLQALIAHVPAQAAAAITRAVERAIERSATAIDRVHDVPKPTPAAGGANNGGSGTGGSAGGAATPKPTKEPAERPEPTAKPTKQPAERPEATPRTPNEPAGQPEPTPRPARTPRPTPDAPQGGGPPSHQPD
ncbi:MAG TPA: hypothetical protein VK867_08555 [Candidatus Limnocylindrales bacterium]|nr:hypothetical protein [Candidatus Limnocylindrales bacterium]